MIVIGFKGKKNSGKSTVADYLVARHGFVRQKMFAPGKEMLRVYLRYRGVAEDRIERMIEGDLKEVPVWELFDKTPRWVMQKWGTEGSRDLIDKRFWSAAWFDHLELTTNEGAGRRILVDDCRYIEEVEAMKATGSAWIVNVVRPGLAANDDHASEEQAFPHDLEIVNDGTVDDLHGKADALLRDLSWAVAA
ncbi:hypothetical protein [Methylosinus sp. PW1]|uniref:deoxynucleotide monophosphate kinase family protein n=1 Tax=Methylosinus sp. PW1 TaxID=107636 RepID=UPI000689E649|nr:hypothetical protein [Methylosinus sp. PW1]